MPRRHRKSRRDTSLPFSFLCLSFIGAVIAGSLSTTPSEQFQLKYRQCSCLISLYCMRRSNLRLTSASMLGAQFSSLNLRCRGDEKSSYAVPRITYQEAYEQHMILWSSLQIAPKHR